MMSLYKSVAVVIMQWINVFLKNLFTYRNVLFLLFFFFFLAGIQEKCVWPTN